MCVCGLMIGHSLKDFTITIYQLDLAIPRGNVISHYPNSKVGHGTPKKQTIVTFEQKQS